MSKQKQKNMDIKKNHLITLSTNLETQSYKHSPVTYGIPCISSEKHCKLRTDYTLKGKTNMD